LDSELYISQTRAQPDVSFLRWAEYRGQALCRGAATDQAGEGESHDLSCVTDGHQSGLFTGRCLVWQSLRANRTDIHHAAKLWQVFRAVLSGALEELTAVLGDAVTALMLETIDAPIHCWFTQVLQLDPKTLRLEAL